jgi:CRISPR-associated endoribonuclease Cas6
MRLKIQYIAENGKLLLPMHYNYLIQSLIYRTFPEETAIFLHDEGFQYQKRKFKLFTFSRILNKGEVVRGAVLSNLKFALRIPESLKFYVHRKNAGEEALLFRNGISFYFSSAKQFIAKGMAEGTILKQQFELLGQKLYVQQIEVMKEPEFPPSLLIKTLSPITVYSTFTNESGKKKTYYYSPNEPEFSALISENIRKKYMLINGVFPQSSLAIAPVFFNDRKNRAVVYFKGIRVEAWSGVFKLMGDQSLIKIAYDTGLGSKNPQGFGMWKIFKPNRNVMQ